MSIEIKREALSRDLSERHSKEIKRERLDELTPVLKPVKLQDWKAEGRHRYAQSTDPLIERLYVLTEKVHVSSCDHTMN